MDTANDLRIRYLECLVNLALKKARKKKGSKALISKVKELKYSYGDRDTVLRYVSEIGEMLETLDVPEPLAGFIREELEDFPRKLSLNVREPYQVFRYDIGEVLECREMDGLWECLVRGKKGSYTVVTNLGKIKRGTLAAVILLPPRKFGDVWSRAMFVKVGVSGPQDIGEEDLRPLNSYFSQICQTL